MVGRPPRRPDGTRLNESPELIAQECWDGATWWALRWRLNESPELIAQESQDLTKADIKILGLNESPELIAQEFRA